MSQKCYHFTETVVYDVKVGRVRWIRDFRQEGGREFVQGPPIYPREELMILEVAELFPPQTDVSVTDEFTDEGTRLF